MLLELLLFKENYQIVKKKKDTLIDEKLLNTNCCRRNVCVDEIINCMRIRINTISIKIPAGYFMESYKLDGKFIRKDKSLEIVQTILKKNKGGGFNSQLQNLIQTCSNQISVVLA